MSHSDSEVNRHRKVIRKANVQVTFKHKLRKLKNDKLLLAAAYNHVEDVANQLQEGACPNYADKHGRSALHIAASKGYSEVVRLLLARGANPNLNDSLKNTPLHLAACTHNANVAQLLLQAGADGTKLDVYGKTPLQIAESKLQILNRTCREGNVEMSKILSELKLIKTLIADYVKELKDVGLDMSKLSLNPCTPEEADQQMTTILSQLQSINIL